MFLLLSQIKSCRFIKGMEIGNTCKNFNTISPTFCLLGQKNRKKMGVKRPITIAVADQGFLKGGGNRRLYEWTILLRRRRDAVWPNRSGGMPPKIFTILIQNGALWRRLMSYFTLNTQMKQVNFNCTWQHLDSYHFV